MRQIFRTDERGVALPMGVLLLLVLTSLMLAFVSLAQTEPMIAANHMLATQARAQAEAGFERARWALSQGAIAEHKSLPIPTNAINPADLPADGSVAPSPYNDSLYMISGMTGGFTVKVTKIINPLDPTRERRVIEATGYAPNKTGPTRSHRKVKATVQMKDIPFNSPCALCVKGDVDISGTSKIDAYGDQTCGKKVGAQSAGTLTKQGTSDVRGATDGNSTWNNPGDYQGNLDPSSFDAITLTSDDFKTLRDQAKLDGTYFGPGYPNGTPSSSSTWTGSVTFDSSNKLKNGIVFIDTVSGKDIPLDISKQNPSDFASVTMNGNPFTGDSTAPNQFSGWIVVNGSLAISGNMTLNGLVYVVNDFTYNGTGAGGINGLVVSQNVRDVTATAISTADPDDSTTVGNSKITFDCKAVRRANPPIYRLEAGSYREVSD
jgi:hypothetical protein